jgi:hypothetical protein
VVFSVRWVSAVWFCVVCVVLDIELV